MNTDIQSIFKLMISRGFYSKEECYMCNSLNNAAHAGVITLEEAKYAQEEIAIYRRYLCKHEWVYETLVNCLQVAFQKYEKEYLELRNYWGDTSVTLHQCKPIYLDWANRPMKENNV